MVRSIFLSYIVESFIVIITCVLKDLFEGQWKLFRLDTRGVTLIHPHGPPEEVV